MSRNPNKPDRKPDGTFAPGNRVGGSKRGSRHKTTKAIEALLEGDHEKLTRKAIELALAGDTVALRLCLDRLAPPRRDAPISMDLPPVATAKDAVAASTAILGAVSDGSVTPDEGARVMALLAAHKGLVETCDLETRLTAIENEMENRR